MRSFESFSQVEACSSLDNIDLEIEVMLEHLLQCQYLRLAVYKGKHDDTDGILQLCQCEQLVQHYFLRCVLFQLDNYTHTFLVGLVTEVVNALDTLLLYKQAYAFEQSLLTEHERYLVDDDAVSALYLLEMCAASEDYLSSSCSISGTYACSAHDYTACWEVGSLYVLHELFKGAVGVLDKELQSVYDLAQIVGRYIGSHTNCDAHRAVYKKIRES